jgi:ArsR family transcriptional regulator
MVLSSPSRATDTAALFHALSDPVRLRVIEMLQDGEHCVCDLTDALAIGQSRLSWHLKTLSDAGMIIGRKSGRWVYYSLDVARVLEARSYLDGIKLSRLGRSRRVNCCE